jgi:hypothetical protein
VRKVEPTIGVKAWLERFRVGSVDIRELDCTHLELALKRLAAEAGHEWGNICKAHILEAKVTNCTKVGPR